MKQRKGTPIRTTGTEGNYLLVVQGEQSTSGKDTAPDNRDSLPNSEAIDAMGKYSITSIHGAFSGDEGLNFYD